DWEAPRHIDGGERDVDGRARVRLGPTLDGNAAEELGEVPLDRDCRRSRGDDALESEGRRVEEGSGDLALPGLGVVESRAQEEERPCRNDGCDRDIDRGIPRSERRRPVLNVRPPGCGRGALLEEVVREHRVPAPVRVRRVARSVPRDIACAYDLALMVVDRG